MNMLSMHAVLSGLHTFPFVGIHSCPDLYSFFRPEPVPFLPFQTSKMLKECFIAMLANSGKTSSAIKHSQKRGTHFRTIDNLYHIAATCI